MAGRFTFNQQAPNAACLCALLALFAIVSLTIPGSARAETQFAVGGYTFRPYRPAATQTAETAPSEPSPAAAQGELQDGVYVLKGDYYKSYAENGWRILTGPLRYDTDDWINVAIVSALTGGFLLADESIRDFWQDDVRSSATDDISDVLYHLGDTKTMLFTALGAYAVSEVTGLKREKAASLMAIESLVLTALLVEGMKYVTGRERPNESDSAYDFKGPGGNGTNASFPSGHAGNAFAVASVMSEVYGDNNPWVPWLAYGVAGGVALSRINDNKHWASDAFLASALGFFIGKMVTRYNPFLEKNGVAMRPFAQDGAQGISLAVKF